MENIDCTFGKLENEFLSEQGFVNFVSHMEFMVDETDTTRPDTMFLRISLARLGKDQQIGVIIEGDYRVFRRWFGLPKGVDVDVILKLCVATSCVERKKMIKEMPVLAEKYIAAYANINDILE